MADAKSLSPSRFIALSSDHIVAQAFWIISGALITALGAQLEIPHQPVPYTFQTLFVILAGGLLGKRNGFISMSLYLGMGLSGLPVFAGGSFGLVKMLGPTGGYLLAFPFAAYLVGALNTRPGRANENTLRLRSIAIDYAWTFGSMLAGLVLIFVLGTIQLNLVLVRNWASSFQSGFLIFSWWDVLKLFAATAICRELRRA